MYHFNDIFPIELAAATGALSTAERSYPMSEVRFRSQEDPMPEGRAAKRSYPTSEVRGSGCEYQTVTVQERPRGATRRPRSGRPAKRRHPASEVRGRDERSYPVSEVRGSGREELSHALSPRPGAAAGRTNPMSKEQWLHGRRRD